MVVTNVLDGASRSAVNREDTLPDEYFPYGFKGALRAPGRCWQLGLDQRRATQALTPMRLSSRPAAGRRSPWGRSRAGRLVPLLGPPGHGGVGALQVPASAASGGPPQGRRPTRALQGQPSSRRFSIEPWKITRQERASGMFCGWRKRHS
jgi:hypothetical protein